MVISNGWDGFKHRPDRAQGPLTGRQGPASDPLVRDLQQRQQRPPATPAQPTIKRDSLQLGGRPAAGTPANPWASLLGLPDGPNLK